MASVNELRLMRTIAMAGADGQAGPVPVTATTSPNGGVEKIIGQLGQYRVSDRAEMESMRIANRMTVLPTQARRKLITQFIGSLMDAGVWDLLDALYVMAAHDSQAALVNWRGAGAQDLVNVNGCVFDPNKGLQGDGSSSYLNTSLAGNAADNYKRDSAFAAIWSVSNLGSNTAHDISGAGGMYINSQAASGSAAARCNNATASSTAAVVSDSLGLTAVSRTTSTDFNFYRNSTLLGNASVASEAVSSAVFWIGRNSTNYSNRKLALAAIGGGLTDAQYQAFYTAARAYMVAVGAAT